MSNNNFPQPPSHKTFVLGKTIIDSDFDSGNCSFAERISSNTVLPRPLSTPSGSPLTIPRTSTACGSTSRLRASPRAASSTFRSRTCRTRYYCAHSVQTALRGACAGRPRGQQLGMEADLAQGQPHQHRNSLATQVYGDNEIEWTFTHQFSSN